MKLFGTLERLLRIRFRKDDQDITLRPNQSTTYSAATDIQTPPSTATQVLVGDTATQTLTNKTLEDSTTFVKSASGTSRQLTLDISSSSNSTLTTVRTTSTSNRIFTLPDATTTLVGHDNSVTLTNKTIDGDDNTIQDLALTSLKTVLADASKFLVRDGSGIVVSNTKAVPSGTVVGTSDTQTLTNKTLQDSTTTLQDNTDPTKFAQLAINTAQTTATTITLDLPAISTELTGNTATQTLTNKTLTSPTLNSATINTSDIGTSLSFANQAAARFLEQTGNGTNYIALTAPDAITTTFTLKLPSADGSTGQFLTTNGAGSLSFTSAAGTSGGLETTDATSGAGAGNKTVGSGQTLTHPFLTISTGDTYTINGRLIVLQELTVDGTLTVNGTSYIHSITA